MPDAYSANRPTAIVLSSSTGDPVTLTASEKSTVTSILEPMPYARLAFAEDTESTDGTTPSTTTSDRLDNDPCLPGIGRRQFMSVEMSSASAMLKL